MGSVEISPLPDGFWDVSPMSLNWTPPIPAENTINYQSNISDLAYQVDKSVHSALKALTGIPSAVSRSYIDKFSEKLPKLSGLLDISHCRPNDVSGSVDPVVTRNGGAQVTVRLQNMDEVSCNN
jgi:hypothetical protein